LRIPPLIEEGQLFIEKCITRIARYLNSRGDYLFFFKKEKKREGLQEQLGTSELY